MRYKILDRHEHISNRGRKQTVEEIREAVCSDEDGIRIGEYNGMKRAGIYRNDVKVVVLAIEDDLTDEDIRANIETEILTGTFDEYLTKHYDRVMAARKAKVNEQSSG